MILLLVLLFLIILLLKAINFSETAGGCFIPNTAAAGLTACDREAFPT